MRTTLADTVTFIVLNIVALTAGIIAIVAARLFGALVRPLSRLV